MTIVSQLLPHTFEDFGECPLTKTLHLQGEENQYSNVNVVIALKIAFLEQLCFYDFTSAEKKKYDLASLGCVFFFISSKLILE